MQVEAPDPLNSPTGQRVMLLPSPHLLPASQSVHTEEPRVLKEPAPQAVQLTSPAWALNPGAHGSHELWSLEGIEPPPQIWHPPVDPSELNLLASHETHSSAPVPLVLPAAQLRQALAPAVGAYLPLRQSEHDVCWSPELKRPGGQLSQLDA